MRKLPNILTISRLLLTAPIILFIFQERLTLALVVYIVAAATDVIDGVVARKQAACTPFGVFVDPLADIVLNGCVYASFWVSGWVPDVVLAVLLARYGTLVLGLVVLPIFAGPIQLKATRVGKIVGVLQAAAAILILLIQRFNDSGYDSAGPVLFPFLVVIFSSVILSQLVFAFRHIQRGTHGRPGRQTEGF